jgi:glycosyltransferase involved in cell wall biosynthesis
MRILGRFKKDAGEGTPVRIADVIFYVNSPRANVQECFMAALESFEGPNFLIVSDTREQTTGEFLVQFAAEHRCRLVQNLDPLGFERSVVKGVRMSRAEYVVVVDSEIVATEGCLRELVERLITTPGADVAVPLLDVQLLGHIGTAAAANAELMAAALDSVARGLCSCSTLDAFPWHPCFALRKAAFSRLAAQVNLLAVPNSYAIVRTQSPKEIFSAALSDDKCSAVTSIRDALPTLLRSYESVAGLVDKNIVFLLPLADGEARPDSIVQEVMGLRRCGLKARIATPAANQRAFEQNYPEAAGLCSYHANDDELLEPARGPSIVIATASAAVYSLKTIVDRNPDAIPLYYIQDYEPWLYPEYDPRHAAAKASYHLIPKARNFAKTEWLRGTLERIAAIEVTKVVPSLDRSLYNGLAAARDKRVDSGAVAITAAILPSSARRNPRSTLLVLRKIKQKYKTRVDIRIYGCGDEELDQLEEARGFDFVNFGELKTAEVAAVLRGADIFVDLSSSLALGCSGLEAMAVGCATVLPRGSGVEEYAVDQQNCLLVDPVNGAEALAALEKLIADRNLEARFRSEALRTGLRYSIRSAVWSLLVLFRNSERETGIAMGQV